MLVWFFVPDSETVASEARVAIAGIKQVARMPAVWLQAIIVVCAYVAYKSTDDFSLLAYDTLAYNEVDAAQVGTVSFWVRPFAAVGAGLLADRIGDARATLLSFGLILIGCLAIGLGAVRPGLDWILFLLVISTSVGIYAARGIYFALFREASVPVAVTGAAVGLVSVIGYTPDVFMGPAMGYLLDRSPGAVGHRHVFLMVAGLPRSGLWQPGCSGG